MRVFASTGRQISALQQGFQKSCAASVPGALLAVVSIFATQGIAAPLVLPLTGNLIGSVVDTAGIPQMGATVLILNKYDRPISRSLTSADGRFAFAALPIDVYSVRVSLASFLPVSRDKIAVKAGLDSVLQIHLATLFSSIQVSYTVPDGAMTSDWKWVLRSSPATRPITRYLPLDPDGEENGADAQSKPRVFSGTRAMLSLSGGDGGLIDTDSPSGDFGTGFFVSTNIYGKNQLQVGGSLGEATTLNPSAISLCAIYSRNDDGAFGQTPEVTFTMAQMNTAASQLAGLQGANGGLGSGAVVRSMSLSVYEVMDPSDNVHLEYGMTGESVDYLQHTSRISPFARVTLLLGKAGQVVAAFSDGGRPDELRAHQQLNGGDDDGTADLNGAVNTISRLPQLSQRDGRLELQRSQIVELGYAKISGSRTYAASAFHEDVTNARTNIAGDLSGVSPANLLYDGVSTTSAFNIGNYQREGYLASVNQRVNEFLNLTVAYGRMGGLETIGSAAGTWGTGKFLSNTNSNVTSGNLDIHVPRAGTKLVAGYGWVDPHTLLPQHIFTTQNAFMRQGLNISVRQPLPSLFGLPGRLELTGDLTNLLAQGYLPLDTGDGHKVLIVQSPRAIRGGLNFIF